MDGHGLADDVVRLAVWTEDDADWYAQSTRDPLIQRFTTESPTLAAAEVVTAIRRLHADQNAEGFLIRDAVTGARLGNIALSHDGSRGEVSYWVAAAGRGRGVATRALTLFTRWSLHTVGLREMWLRVHEDNVASARTAIKAGYRRDLRRDTIMEVNGTLWPMIGYTLQDGDHGR